MYIGANDPGTVFGTNEPRLFGGKSQEPGAPVGPWSGTMASISLLSSVFISITSLFTWYRGTSLKRNAQPSRTTVWPYA